MEKVE